MSKIKNIRILITGAIGAFLMLVIQSKNRKIEKQKEQIKQQQSKNEQIKYINDQESKAKHEKNTINSSSESDVDKLLEQAGSYRD